MGGAVAARSSVPPGGDFLSLFAFRGYDAEHRTGEFKYEPPGKSRDNLTASNSGWLSPWPRVEIRKKKAGKNAWEVYLDQAVASQEDSVQDLAETSKEKFEALLRSKSQLNGVDAENILDLADFLRTSADEPGARNTSRLVQWLSSRVMEDDAIRVLHSALLEKTNLQTLSLDETSAVLATLITHNDARLNRTIIAILDSYRASNGFQDLCETTTLQIFAIADRTKATNLAVDFVQKWLYCLRRCEGMQELHDTSTAWRKVYAVLAPRIPSFGDLAEHFSKLMPANLSRVLLRHWVPLIISEKSRQERTKEAEVSDVSGWRNFRWPSSTTYDADGMMALFEKDCITRVKTRRQRLVKKSPLVQLLVTLEQQGFPTKDVTESMFTILLHTKNVQFTYSVFRQVWRSNVSAIDTKLAARLVHYFSQEGRLSYAFSVFCLVRSLPLSLCFDLPIKLVKAGRLPRLRLWTLLSRQTSNDFLPPSRRPIKTSTVSLTTEHIDLVHLIALEYSESPFIRPRVALRRVWECYLFLRDRQVPMNSLISRALITAGVVRYLKVGQRPPLEALQEILSIVERIEGSQIAVAIDRAVLKLWQREVLPGLMSQHSASSTVSETIRSAFGPENWKMSFTHTRHRFVKWFKQHRGWLQLFHHRCKKCDGVFRTNVALQRHACSSRKAPRFESLSLKTGDLAPTRSHPNDHEAKTHPPRLTDKANGAALATCSVGSACAPFSPFVPQTDKVEPNRRLSKIGSEAFQHRKRLGHETANGDSRSLPFEPIGEARISVHHSGIIQDRNLTQIAIIATHSEHAMPEPRDYGSAVHAPSPASNGFDSLDLSDAMSSFGSMQDQTQEPPADPQSTIQGLESPKGSRARPNSLSRHSSGIAQHPTCFVRVSDNEDAVPLAEAILRLKILHADARKGQMMSRARAMHLNRRIQDAITQVGGVRSLGDIARQCGHQLLQLRRGLRLHRTEKRPETVSATAKVHVQQIKGREVDKDVFLCRWREAG